ncbi:MAG TPA: hypothetical protein VNU48_08875 [Burkholderiaceae bacterium]|nr:hypothetical protein [Burkholderiaceae bacterium]
MYRERQHDAGFKSDRQPTRKEWGHGGEEQHQLEARERARQPGRMLRTHEVRAAEAERQIRELRDRY